MIQFLNKPQNTNSNYHDFEDRLASITKFHDDTTINLSDFDVALLGVEEEKNTSDIIRKYFYELYKPNNLRIIDLGNFNLEQNLESNYQKINEIFEILINNNVKLMFLGKKNELNIAFYKYFQKTSYNFNSINIDSKIDYQLSNNSSLFLNYFDKKTNLFENFHLFGYQKYLVNPKIKEEVLKLGFTTHRLSEIKKDIIEFEPYIRISDIISIDISSVKAADAPASKASSPNGFSANEICRLAYFAGLSDRIKTLNMFEIDLDYDTNNTTAKLSAQFFWHFLDALSSKKSVKYNKQNDFAVYFTKQLNDEQKKDLKFMHCEQTNRWWLAININTTEKKLPCSYKDYELAKTQKLTPRIISYISQQ